ncbi:MAG: glycosyltransferase family 2 protein [Chloroflexi bacterium]|nr:glycosyltransferase family 2 protein [Chloroflexota bacterium]MCI0579613.1 glycosyltransferase family 2 protein [Chloroflexota bacterium]MCI0644826.1 glycosyltransferase family 2 protein [Chloroflexota bacterium]MCI0731448.1 glycosyltransferase family 2 protein [Chloroflexota bacterium]
MKASGRPVLAFLALSLIICQFLLMCMKLTVIIPIYNEASTLAPLLARVEAVPVDKEILVVDDGSDDATKEVLRQAVTGETRLITHAENRGKGTAIRTALAEASGDVVIIQDADLEYFPEDYVRLLEMYEKNQARAVYGVRDLSHRSWLMRWGNKAMTLATNLLYGYRLRDMETCYKLVDRRLFQSLELQSRRFEIEAEITAKLLRLGVKILETPIRYEHREEGKKLTPWDGFPTLAKLLECRFWRPGQNSNSVIG